jgi:serine/threonine protein kinase
VKKFLNRAAVENLLGTKLNMLQMLSQFPHDHIVTHLMTWTQGEEFHMLLPLAAYNLRGYMEAYPSSSLGCDEKNQFNMPCDMPYRRPLLDGHFVRWFFNQLVGLGEGIDHIHHLPGDAFSGNQGNMFHCGTGFHHAIKLENILVFRDGLSSYGTFKISDFGSGSFQSKSFRSHDQLGAPWESMSLNAQTYGGLKASIKCEISCPYDMWSIGSIILEMLSWIFDTFPLKSSGFATETVQPGSREPDNTNDQFWLSEKRPSGRVFSLKPAVQKKLKLLKDEYCLGRRAFQETISIVEKLLVIDAEKRMKASELASALRAIAKQAKRELERDPACYQKRNGYQRPT